MDFQPSLKKPGIYYRETPTSQGKTLPVVLRFLCIHNSNYLENDESKKLYNF